MKPDFGVEGTTVRPSHARFLTAQETPKISAESLTLLPYVLCFSFVYLTAIHTHCFLSISLFYISHVDKRKHICSISTFLEWHHVLESLLLTIKSKRLGIHCYSSITFFRYVVCSISK